MEKHMRTYTILTIFFIMIFSFPALANKNYVCALKANNNPLNSNIIKIALIYDKEKNIYNLNENVSIRKDTSCDIDRSLYGSSEIVCLGTRFYFSLYKNDLKATISYWSKKENYPENKTLSTLSKIRTGNKSKDNKTDITHKSTTGDCDEF